MNSFILNMIFLTSGIYIGQEYKSIINVKNTTINIINMIQKTDIYKEICKSTNDDKK